MMIVDDESLVRIGFQTIIDWENHGYHVSGVYRNGLEAWEAIEHEGPPDVLLTDIRMPEMDGLELIHRIREKNIVMNILILSSHEEFKYLRTSIQLGVQDYILKHLFDPDELIQILNQLNYSHLTESSIEEQIVVADLDLEKQLLLRKTRTLSGIIMKETGIEVASYPNLLRKWNNNETHGCWIVIRALPSQNGYLDSDLKALGYLLQELIERFSQNVYIGMDQNLFHFQCFPESEVNIVDEKIFAEISDTVRHNLNIPIVVGISERGAFLTEMIKMRKQAEDAVYKSFYFGAGIYQYNSARPMTNIMASEWVDLKKKALELLKDKQRDSIYKWMSGVGELFAEKYTPEEAVRFLQMVYQQFIKSRAERFLVDKDTLEKEINPLVLTYEISEFVSSWPELLRITQDMMEEQDRAFLLITQRSPWLETVITFIHEHYAESIRLEEAAQITNFNTNYFSQLFRNETGFTFLEYVTKVRIDKARELLENPKLSAEEIASRIGYPNANYFVKVFKKVTGTTVSEYRTLLKS
ncbi:response regulator transcription factor [Niallia nealsonii]|uniref:response regulator transcription factor n=1 Tax=Niallia nealsonii TaxID=115979 RepID=UPI001F1E1E40|nr:response regulator [Niallia nealsonii]